MKILFLSPRFPLPADTGGKIRTLNILKQLLKYAQVHLLSFSYDPADAQLKEELKQLGLRITLVPALESSSAQKVWNVLTGDLPHAIIKYQSLAMRSAMEALIKAESFDAVHIDHLHMAHYSGTGPGVPKILDEHNVEFKILERCAQVEANPIKKMLYLQQAGKMKTYEVRQAKTAQSILACSQEDRSILENLVLSQTPVQVIPNGVDTEYFQSADDNKEEGAMVFTGSMDWLPNEDAVSYFCAEILPLIWARQPSAKLYVVGKSPSGLVKSLAGKDPRVIVTGRVDDVRPYVQRCEVFIVPLRIGGGTRLKILEAMSMSRPVVSTFIGAEGIQHTAGANILLADGPADFAQAIVRVLHDKNLAKALAQEGRRLVCGSYSWDIIGRQLKSVYAHVLRTPQI